MRDFYSMQSTLGSSWNQVWSSFFTILPQVVGAVALILVGFFVAGWLKRLVTHFLKVFKTDDLSKKLGVEDLLKKAEYKMSLSEVAGVVVQWLTILVFFLAVSDVLGLSVVSSVLVKILSFIPNVVAAALIFGAGFFVANLVENLVRGALSSFDNKAAKPVSKFARGLILLISFFAALDQLHIAQGLVATFYQGLTYTIVLAVGLSVGLGGKDLVSKILDDWYKKVTK